MTETQSNIAHKDSVENTEKTGEDGAILSVHGLRKWFPVSEQTILFSRTVGYIKAVDNIDFSVRKGETLGIVGESGCGKSTTGRLIMQLETPTDGSVVYRGENIYEFNEEENLEYRNKVQMVFQDPYSSLNPRMKVLDIIKEPYDIREEFGKKYGRQKLILSEVEKRKRVMKLLNVVGLESYHSLRYPHEFSGGQRQRIGIARALAANPEILILDEPVSALDVSVQAAVLNLLNRIQDEFDLTYIFIAHDLSVIKHISDRVCVMYLGKIMEIADVDKLFNSPHHPYTHSLLSAIPKIKPQEQGKRIILKGDVPSPINPPSGCVFHTRCYKAEPECSEIVPELEEHEEDHFAACLFPENVK